MKKMEIPNITAVLNSLRRMSADELLVVIEAANFELAQAIDEKILVGAIFAEQDV